MKHILALLLAGVCTTGCTLGPRDLNPHAELPAAPPLPEPISPATGPVQAISDTPARSDWWRSFGNADIDRLVDLTLAHDNDLAVAEASLRQARELASATAGSALPQIDASYQAQRARVSDALSTAIADPNQQLYSIHTAQLSVSYGLDLFGGNRSHIRSARAQAEVQAHRLDAARASAIANLIEAVIQRAALAGQIEAAQTSVAANRDILDALKKRQQLGSIGEADIATQQAALATAEGALPALIRGRGTSADHHRHADRPAGGQRPAAAAVAVGDRPAT